MAGEKTFGTASAKNGKRSSTKSRASGRAGIDHPARSKARRSKGSSGLAGSIEERGRFALDFAKSLASKKVDWITINNALFGPGGKLTQLFPNIAERAALAGTAAYKELCRLLDQERDHGIDESATQHATASGQTIVRMPKSLHAALLAEAEAEGVSLNQLCVSKLSMQLRAAAAGNTRSAPGMASGK